MTENPSRITISEFGRINHSALKEKQLVALKRLDETNAVTENRTIFDWRFSSYIKARNYVGVIQVPGLSIEILPKIDDTDNPDKQQLGRAQSNLLYMLTVAGWLPARDRDLAGQAIQRLPLLEALIGLFSRHLLRELRRGVHHEYYNQEENLRFFKGKLLVAQQIRHNAAHDERLFMAFDEFVADTKINQILKAACQRLMRITRFPGNQQLLSECLLSFGDVIDEHIQSYHFEQLTFDRNSERFSPLVDFARLILRGQSPDLSAEKSSSYSLLFPMERVFEQFIGNTLKRNASQLGLNPRRIRLSARGDQRYLLKRINPLGSKSLRMKPDILIDRPDRSPLIIDTKWKRLKTLDEDRRNGVSPADLYQLYAYAHRYDSSDNVLLYPQVAGIMPQEYGLDGEASGKRLRIEFVDVSYDLIGDRGRFISALKRVLSGASISHPELQSA